MTIDERLDRLTERHEALTQTAELMVHEQREWQAKTQQRQDKAQEWQDKNQVLLSQVLESIDSLTRVALVHERRITNLEGQHGS